MNNSDNEKSKKYFNGGFAEIVSEPSDLTFSYLKQWFSGIASVGQTMDMLGLPFEEVSESLLEMNNGELVVNLDIEEKTLYKNTLFSYGAQSSSSATPQLKLNWLKVFNPITWIGTSKIILAQSKWIANPTQTSSEAEKWVTEIPDISTKDSMNKDELSLMLETEVWPKVLAIGIIAEFYQQYLSTQLKDKFSLLEPFISEKISLDDWFFGSISSQQKVKDGSMTFEEYLHIYGMRSDKDYELTSPRWFEIKSEIKKRIDQFSSPEKRAPDPKVYDDLSTKMKTTVDAYIKLQILRSEAKRKMLPYINLLRQKLSGEIKNETTPQISNDENPQAMLKTFGKGTPVCSGEILGICKQIKTASDSLGDATIGIFPNASPEFAVIYPKCKGMIFLKGGQTSHGAIVAREFQIPSLIDNLASSIPANAEIVIDGGKGEWRISK